MPGETAGTYTWVRMQTQLLRLRQIVDGATLCCSPSTAQHTNSRPLRCRPTLHVCLQAIIARAGLELLTPADLARLEVSLLGGPGGQGVDAVACQVGTPTASRRLKM